MLKVIIGVLYVLIQIYIHFDIYNFIINMTPSTIIEKIRNLINFSSHCMVLISILFSRSNKSVSAIKVRNCLIIPYNYGGLEYNTVLPLNEQHKLIGAKINATFGSKVYDITHNLSGVYNFTPDDIGADQIEIKCKRVSRIIKGREMIYEN